ncbi:MAG: hypothetical protein VZS44_00280 [Bacilli bacterium]|nr:hypothetical protein [Bacilli bacterium]
MNFKNNILNNNGNVVRDRSEDLTKVFDRKYHANHDVNEQVQQRKKDFNAKMFGIRDQEDVRREMREANSVNGQVKNLQDRMSSMNNRNGGFR